MKKFSSVIIIAVLLILAVLSVFIYKSKHASTTVDEDARNFKIKDTAAITKIFIADKEGDNATITRTPKGWVVNEKYNCRTDAILNLLEVIKHVEVKMPVPKTAKDAVLKLMASTALKVEIYTKDGLVKQYYVGHETPDSEGSYMILTNIETGENYKDPYVCFIPGFKGYLIPRFIAKENEWRDRIVLNYIPPQLKQIKVQHFNMQDSSFTVDLNSTTSFSLKNSKGSEIPFDEMKMKQYLAYFQNISYEVLITGKNKKLTDSLFVNKPFAVISITTTDFKTSEYKFYNKTPNAAITSEIGVNYQNDPDRLYLQFANDKEWALIQYFVFGKLLITQAYFEPNVSVKK
ncbi:MAG: DUF4340 domain-containing protein [Bacteroidota bacterium]|nr:DUF4340 domain-containing protein [Bacteroidota bacterium]